MLTLLRSIEAKVDRCLGLLVAIARAVVVTETELKTMSAEFDTLTAEVAATKSVEESAVKALLGIKAQLDAALASSDAPAALKALSDSLGTETTALAAAVATVTPPAPAPVPAPAPAP